MIIAYNENHQELIDSLTFKSSSNFYLSKFDRLIEHKNSYKKNRDVIKFSKKLKDNLIVLTFLNSDELVIMYKNYSTWKVINQQNVDYIFLNLLKKKKIWVESIDQLPDRYLLFLKSKHKISKTKNESDYILTSDLKIKSISSKTNSLKFEFDKILFIESKSSLLTEFKISTEEFGQIDYLTNEFEVTETNFNNFKENILSINPIDDIKKEKFLLEKTINNEIHLKYSSFNGITYCIYNMSTKNFRVKVFSISKSWTQQYYYSRGILNAIKFYVNKELEEKFKIPKGKIIFALFGLGIFITLTALTFIHIFDAQDLVASFATIGKSFNTPWPYLLFLNYLLTSCVWLIIGYYMSLREGKKYSFKAWAHWWVSGHFKSIVGIISGSHIFSMLAWVWFMKLGKDNTHKSATLIGRVAVMTIFEAFFTIVVGTFFLSFNSYYAFTLDWGQSSWFGAPWLVGLSWAGMIVQQLVSLSSSLFFLLPSLNRVIFFVWSWKVRFTKSDNFFEKTEGIAVRAEQFKKERKSIFDKTAMKRFIYVTLFIHLTNFFELSYMISIVANSYFEVLNSENPYWYWTDIFQINSLRIAIMEMNKLNPLPGEMYTTELTQVAAYQALLSTYTNIAPGSESLTQISTEAGFVSRFFGFYLPTLISGFVAVIASIFKYKYVVSSKSKKIKVV